MLDAFTSFMCMESWGRIGFAHALIEVSADKKLKQDVIMVVPLEDGTDTLRRKLDSNMNGSYRCALSVMSLDMLLNNVLNVRKKGKKKDQPRVIEGLKLYKPKSSFVYRPKNTQPASKSNEDEPLNVMNLKNHFDALRDQDDLLRESEAGESSGVNRDEGKVDDTESGLHKNVVHGLPWILMGDFNVALNLKDRFLGSSCLNSAMYEVKDCVANIEIIDLNCSGVHFTWNQKPKSGASLLKKLDRIMGNLKFEDVFPGAFALCQPYRIPDHTSAVLQVLNLTMIKPKPFKFFNFLAYKSEFLDVVANYWNSYVAGHNMFQVVTKMKSLKKTLRKLLRDHEILHDRVVKLCHELGEVQKVMDLNPADSNLKDEEAMHVKAFTEAKMDEEQNQRSGPLRCAFKVDIQKAYDMIDWRFLDTILKCFGFHPTMVKWIMACVSSTSFYICLNGDVHVFFKGMRGLRQGDPLSPYLFTLVMEILSLIIKRRVRLSDAFCYHHHCEELGIINFCFADDLFIFMTGKVEPAKIIMDSLEEFKQISGLASSLKYLGVPLISSRLLNKDCKILVEKAKNLIGDWKNKSLSFAGWLQLCMFVISSMHVYWAWVIFIPKGIIHDIQQLIKGFLWCNEEFKRGKAKVAWEAICLPKMEGRPWDS
nr:hypothetical protein [Tanacetum cinerariifolium]GFA10816.1 hypothetical protein [Tanacetum cinerariifolium]